MHSESATMSADTGAITDEYELVLTAAQVQALREWTLQDDGVERSDSCR